MNPRITIMRWIIASWVQDDELTAMLAGDLVCMDGGIRGLLPGGGERLPDLP